MFVKQILLFFIALLITSPVLALPSQLFFEETSQIDPNKTIQFTLAANNNTGYSAFNWPGVRLDYTHNPLAEIKITNDDAGLKMIIGDNLALYGSVKYNFFQVSDIRETLKVGFCYWLNWQRLSINLNPYIEGDRARVRGQGNLGLIYEYSDKLNFIGELLYHKRSNLDYYYAGVLGFRFIPFKNFCLDLIVYDYLNGAQTVPANCSGLALPVQLKISYSY